MGHLTRSIVHVVYYSIIPKGALIEAAFSKLGYFFVAVYICLDMQILINLHDNQFVVVHKILIWSTEIYKNWYICTIRAFLGQCSHALKFYIPFIFQALLNPLNSIDALCSFFSRQRNHHANCYLFSVKCQYYTH